MSEKKQFILKAEKVIALLGGLQALGGYDRIVKDGASEKTAYEPYKLGAGLRRVIGKNIAALTRLNADTVAAQRALIIECGAFEKGSAEESRYNLELMRLLETEEEVDLTTMSSDALLEHPIPGPVLGVLDDLLED